MGILCPFCGSLLELTEKWENAKGKRAGTGAFGRCTSCGIRVIFPSKEVLQNVVDGKKPVQEQKEETVKVEQPANVQVEEQAKEFVPFW